MINSIKEIMFDAKCPDEYLMQYQKNNSSLSNST